MDILLLTVVCLWFINAFDKYARFVIIVVNLDENSPVFCPETDDDETDDERESKNEAAAG